MSAFSFTCQDKGTHPRPPLTSHRPAHKRGGVFRDNNLILLLPRNLKSPSFAGGEPWEANWSQAINHELTQQ